MRLAPLRPAAVCAIRKACMPRATFGRSKASRDAEARERGPLGLKRRALGRIADKLRRSLFIPFR